MSNEPIYDLAFSFAGEHRDYVEATKLQCEQLGLKVFYDKDLNNEWWGNNYIREQRTGYGRQTRYFVPFISVEYFEKPIPRDEFEAAMWTDVERGGGYILPVVIGDVQIPEDRLPRHRHYLKAEDYSPAQLAQEMKRKVSGETHPPKDVADVVAGAMTLRMPKVVPQNFSKYQELEVVLQYLGQQFQKAIPRLHSAGFAGTARVSAERVAVRVEKSGSTVYALDIYPGGLSDGTLAFSLDQHRLGGSGMHAFATPVYDREAGGPRLELTNFSLLDMSGGVSRTMTKDELFTAIWDRLIEQIERR
ncbi:TIR domain-containing protein [Streptomyces canus]|uniref:TIR domain-containing protein n=1 Tax=Streptomyces canus TaxID=58343 RepID=UPI00342409D1